MLNRIILLLFLTFVLGSCSTKNTESNAVFWGETDYYTNFLFSKYAPVIMTKKIELDFNEDAQNLINDNIEFELVIKHSDDKFISVQDIILYKNGKVCDNNILSIQSNESQVDVGFEFTPEAKEGNHTLYLRVRNTGGLDRVDDTDLETSDILVLSHQWVVKKDDIRNPLALGSFWTLIIILTILILWRFLIRPIRYQTFKVKKLYIFCPDSPMKSLRLKGCYKVVVSNKKYKQSVFSRFFQGKVAFARNDFWTEDVVFVPRNKKNIRIRLPKGFNISPNHVLTVGIDTEITNSTNNKTTNLQIN